MLSCCAHAGEGLGAMVSWQCARLRISGPYSSPDLGYSILYLGKTFHSPSAFLHPGIKMCTGDFNAGGDPAID